MHICTLFEHFCQLLYSELLNSAAMSAPASNFVRQALTVIRQATPRANGKLRHLCTVHVRTRRLDLSASAHSTQMSPAVRSVSALGSPRFPRPRNSSPSYATTKTPQREIYITSTEFVHFCAFHAPNFVPGFQTTGVANGRLLVISRMWPRETRTARTTCSQPGQLVVHVRTHSQTLAHAHITPERRVDPRSGAHL